MMVQCWLPCIQLYTSSAGTRKTSTCFWKIRPPRRKPALALVTKWCPSSFLAFFTAFSLHSGRLYTWKKQSERSTQWGGQQFPSTSTGQQSVSPNMWCLLASLAGATVTSPLIPVPHKGVGTIWNPLYLWPSNHPPEHHKTTFGYFSRVTCASFSSIIQVEAEI